MLDRSRVAALLPVNNEARNLQQLLERIKKQGLFVLVVDDGSEDTSVAVARASGVEVLPLGKNLGKGRALRAGFDHLLQGSYDWILIMDSDGQHLPEEIPLFLQKAASGEYGIVNGNRLENPKKMPLVRYWTNRIMSVIVSRLIRQEVRDSQCGYKMLSTKFLREAHLTADHFEIEDDILLEAARLHYSIVHVPITSVYGKEVSRIHPIGDTVRFIRFIFQWWRLNYKK